MLPLSKYVGLPIDFRGKRVRIVRLSEVPYPNVFVNCIGNRKPPLVFCHPTHWPEVYQVSLYTRIPLVTSCPSAVFLCQANCPRHGYRCSACHPHDLFNLLGIPPSTKQ